MSEWVHYSNQTEFDENRSYDQLPEMWTARILKPNGLWMCPGDEWRLWATVNEFRRGEHRWRLSLGAPEHVCFVRTAEEMDAFCIKYGYICKSFPMQHRKKNAVGDRFDDFEFVGECAPVEPHHLLPLGEPPEFPDSGTPMDMSAFIDSFSKFHDWRQAEKERTGHEYPFHLRWDRIMQDYAGLIIDPYLDKRRHISWYYGWDVPGGVVWDLARAKIRRIDE